VPVTGAFLLGDCAVHIDSDLIRFCAEKTRDIVNEYNAAWDIPKYEDGFPRSADDLHLIMMGRHGLPIYHKVFDKIHWRDTRSLSK
jgi:hypothetical protein